METKTPKPSNPEVKGVEILSEQMSKTFPVLLYTDGTSGGSHPPYLSQDSRLGSVSCRLDLSWTQGSEGVREQSGYL